MKNTTKLTILHNNDIHGDFIEEKIDDEYIGGLSLLSGYINEVREQEENVVYAIAGDMFRGSIIDSEFKGISTVEMINLLEPDIVTIGNHEIDYGIAHLLFIEKCATFPIINANLHIKSNHANLFTPFKILEIADMNVLFIGIVTEEVLSAAKVDALIGSFIDTREAAAEIGKICNAYNSIDIDFTVLITHIGIEEDIKLAKMLDPDWGVDLIIGGHSHTFMDEPLTVNDIVIAHAGEGSDNIGRFDIIVDTDDNCIDSYTWNFVKISDKTSKRDLQMEEIINKYKGITDEKYGRIVTRFRRQLTHPARTEETTLGNLFADILKESLALDIMLLGSGSIRGQTLGPIVDLGTLTEIFPYDDEIHMIKVSGKMLLRMLKRIMREEAFLGLSEFYQFSKGLQIKYSKTNNDFEYVLYNGRQINDDDIFSIGLQNFHYQNIEDFMDVSQDELENIFKPKVISTSTLDILEEYLRVNRRLYRDIEGRIEIID